MKVVHTAIMMILGIVLPLVVQLWDKRRLAAEQQARSWNFATWGAALYAFGPASMLGWIYVTRPKWRRVVIAPLWTVPLIFLLWLADGLLSWALQDEAFEVDGAELAWFGLAAAVASSLVVLLAEVIALIAEAMRRRRGSARAEAAHRSRRC